jgi:tetratricopeptide (TPR) repeat protein
MASVAPRALADDAREKAPKARALELFEQSARAYRDGRFQDAIDLLLEARRVKPEPVLLYNLGRAYEALGKPAEAANAYAEYIAEDPRAVDRRAIEGRIATLRAQAEQLDKAKSPPPPPPPPAAPAPPAPAAPLADREEPTVVPWVITGVGIAGVGAGVALAIVASIRHDDAVNEAAQRPAQEKQDQAETFATGATIAFITGGVVAAGGLTWLGIRAFGTSSRGGASVRLLPGPGALTLSGRF